MEGEAQCTGTRRKEGSCIGLQEISKLGRNLSNDTHPQYADKLLRDY